MTQPPDPPGGRHTSGNPWWGLLTGLIGFVTFVVVNVALAGSTVSLSSEPQSRREVVVVAVILLLIALAGLLLVVRGRSYAVKGFGIGLMIGWALASIVSAGYCTGVNPSFYAAPPL